ncbi:MAG TPA: hypothetical protein VJ739_18610 [Gemmataceae bacterium]|nr:hypothetical protein [Gemmataceae bacterium]
MTAPATDTQKIWTTFLMEAELAKHYKMANVISSVGGPPAPNPILDMLLPSLLYMRLGSLIDEGLVEYLDLQGLFLTKGYRDDFNGRTCFLDDQGKLNDAAKIHAIRKQRNLLAHEADQSCTWDVLAGAIFDGHAELQHLGLVGSRPVYEFFGERSGIKASQRGHKFAMDYVYGLKEGGRPVIKVSWTVDFGGEGENLAKQDPAG